MISGPHPIAPRLGPTAAPTEEDAADAYPELRAHALTVAWAAEALARPAAELLGLARAGALLVVPGPLEMRLADYPGYLVPAWQLLPGGRGPHPDLPAVIAAAAGEGWTSLELHRFMTTPLEADGAIPAALLAAGDSARVAELIHGEPAALPTPPPPAARPRRRARLALHAPHRARPASG